MIQRPVYCPFSEIITANGRRIVNNPLVYKDLKYNIDFDDFERKIAENKVKLFLLCSPHNPVGRVWTRDELIKMGNICLKYNCLVAADEVHCDFMFGGHRHLVFGSLSPELLNNSIICTSPSKTFNLSGLQVANIFIANEKIRDVYEREILKTGYSQINMMGPSACKTAYSHGKEWFNRLSDYLSGNVAYLRKFLKERLPQIKLVEPEGTYLVWLDFNDLGLSHSKLDSLITDNAKLWLDSGTMFGEEGEGFQRINIACPKDTLESALIQLENTIKTTKEDSKYDSGN